MDIKQKEYYRLSEVSASFDLTEEHLFYLAENEKLTFSLQSKLDKFVLGAFHKTTKKFVGLSVAEYRGLISIPLADMNSLLEQKNVDVGACYLLQKERIKLLQSDYPFDIKYPNNLVSDWTNIDINNVDWLGFYAKPLPMQELSAKKQLFNTLGSLAAQFAKNVGAKVEDTQKNLEQVNSMPDYVFSNSTRTFVIEDVRITHQALVEAGLASQTSNIAQLEKVKQKGRKTDMTLIIQRLLTQFPTLPPDKLWSKLKMDLNITEREFDVDEIIVGMTDEYIDWINKKSEISKYQRKSFNNKIYAINGDLN